MKALIVVPVAFLTMGCGGSAGEVQLAAVPLTSSQRVVLNEQSLADFRPAREAVLEGGECTARPLPQDGAKRLTVHFPSRTSPEMLVSLSVAADGSSVRYTETRGVPQPGASIAEVRARGNQMVRTQVHLDFLTGEALVLNLLPGEQGNGIRGSVADFEASEALGSLSGRAALVRAICGTEQNGIG